MMQLFTVAVKNHAEYILKELQLRMQDCKLELHPEKIKMVYCRDYRRRGKHPDVKFDFLGYSFQPRINKSKRTGNLVSRTKVFRFV